MSGLTLSRERTKGEDKQSAFIAGRRRPRRSAATQRCDVNTSITGGASRISTSLQSPLQTDGMRTNYAHLQKAEEEAA